MDKSIMLSRTISLLHQCKGKYRDCAADVGLSYSWVRKVACGSIDNPGINELEALYKVLFKRIHGVAPATINILSKDKD
jgi:hypothetical protein